MQSVAESETLMTILYIIAGTLLLYVLFTLFLTYLVQQIPRNPVMIIHGEKDRRFPLAFALTLRESFSSGQTDLYVAEGAGHSESSQTPGYPAAVKSFLDRHWPVRP